MADICAAAVDGNIEKRNQTAELTNPDTPHRTSCVTQSSDRLTDSLTEEDETALSTDTNVQRFRALS